MTRVEVESLFRLTELTKAATQMIRVVETSARTGSQLEEVQRWLYENHKDTDDTMSWWQDDTRWTIDDDTFDDTRWTINDDIWMTLDILTYSLCGTLW